MRINLDTQQSLIIYEYLLRECNSITGMQYHELGRTFMESWIKQHYSIEIEKSEDGGWQFFNIPDEELTLILLKKD